MGHVYGLCSDMAAMDQVRIVDGCDVAVEVVEGHDGR